ncbi:MAG: NADase-type glycan-binding domain-containing protein, partial [Fibrobacterota bacterium]
PPDQYVDISSSSFRAGDIPQNILDGNLETVWSEGAAGDGVGEWIQLEFLHPNRFILAHLIPACITSESCYTEQNRIKKLEIMKRFSDGKTEIKTITLDDKQFVEKRDDQVNIRHYALDIDLMNVSKVRFTIKEVYDGTGDMTSISEILVYAHPELVY